MAQQAENV